MYVIPQIKKDTRVLVVGDSCTDEFVYGICNRLAPEGPIPVFKPVHRTINKGMAANVVENIKSLSSINVELLTSINEIVKARYVDEHTNHTIIRIDTNDFAIGVNHDVLESYLIMIKDYSALIVSDYDKGFLDKESILKLGKAAKDAGIPSFIDTKKPIESWWIDNFDFIKINFGEYSKLISLTDLSKVIVTRGGCGADYQYKNYPVKRVDVKDLSGAGDTFLAALVVEYLKSKDIPRAIKFANASATQVVQKRGVVCV